MDDNQMRGLRNGIEALVVRAEALTTGRGHVIWELGVQSDSVEVLVPDESSVRSDLTPLKQLALSVLVGEPIPPMVLLGALEDAGIYPDGVLAAAKAAEDAPLDMGKPVYDEREGWEVGRRRYREVVSVWCKGQCSHVCGVCKGLFGHGQSGIGNMFRRFLDEWLGHLTHVGGGVDRVQFPTTAYLTERMAKFPPLPRVFRHLRTTANPTTAAQLTRLIEHLERR